jgi:diaminohydroxyphosphoribosylaminopyrimidine deaminase / 5-amino-6-(5-phosphoribosylamino)uracil reductase
VCSDFSFLERAIELGRLSLPLAGVNPAVGALVAAGGRVLGEGYHRGPGTPHAEAAAIAAALEALGSPAILPPDTTLFCTLEPCCHSGEGKRTPPCTEAIIASGIRRVVFACRDPNPRVSGRGAARLREAGIAVEEGVLAERAAALIESFSISIRDKRPFIRLKWAQSLDGRIACRGGASKWITNEAARDEARALRADHDAIMIGANTLRLDDPRLTVRGSGNTDRPEPRRLVLAGRQPLDLSARLFSPQLREGTTVLAATASPGLRQCRNAGIRTLEIARSEGGLPDLEESFRALYADGIGSVMVEGGAALISSLLKRGFWDALTVFMAPLILGEGIAAVGDLAVPSPDLGIEFGGFHFKPGACFARIAATRGSSRAAEEEAPCSPA